MGKTVSFISMKGGAGVSTMVVLVAHTLAGFGRWNKRVLVIDLSQYTGTSKWLLGEERWVSLLRAATEHWCPLSDTGSNGPGGGSADQSAFSKSIINVAAYEPGGGRIDLVPVQAHGVFFAQDIRKHPLLLPQAIQSVMASYDVVVIDASPANIAFAPTVYLSSDFLVMPMVADGLCMMQLEHIGEAFRKVEDQYPGNSVSVAGIARSCPLSHYCNGQEFGHDVFEAASQFGWRIFASGLPHSPAVAKRYERGRPMFQMRRTWSKPKAWGHALVEEIAGAIGL